MLISRSPGLMWVLLRSAPVSLRGRTNPLGLPHLLLGTIPASKLLLRVTLRSIILLLVKMILPGLSLLLTLCDCLLDHLTA